MKKTYLSLIPLMAFLLTGCPGSEPTPTPDQPDDGYIHSVKEVRELDYAPDNVKINGRVIAKGTNAFLVYDGTGIILAYGYQETGGVRINDKVTLTGATGYKGGVLAQFGTDDEGGSYTVTAYDGDVPEYNKTPTEVTSLDALNLDEIKYVSIEKTISYKDGNFYQSNPLNEGEDGYLSYSGSLSEYTTALAETSAEAPICVNVEGFLTDYVPSTQMFFSGNRFNMMLNKAVEPVELELLRVTASDSFPYYNLSTAFDDFAEVEVHAIYERGLDRLIQLKDTSYVVESINGGNVNTAEPFSTAGQYIVTVTYEGVSAEPFDIKVYDNNDKVAYATADMLATRNGWQGNTYNSTANLDENVQLTVTGSRTGHYSSTNGCWTVTQEANSTYPDGGYLKVEGLNDYYINQIHVKYSPNPDDEEARNGYLENLPSNTLVGVGLKSNTYFVKSNYTEVVNARVRLRSILVTYSETEPVVTMTGISARDTKIGAYERFTPFAESNGLIVTAIYDNGRMDTLKSNEYEYVIKDAESNVINPSEAFPHGGDYEIYVTKGELSAPKLTFYVTDLVSLALSDTHEGDYERFSSFAMNHGLKVTATYDNDKTAVVKDGSYSYTVKDSEGVEIDPTQYFPSVGTFKVVAKIGDVSSNEITIRVSTTGVITVSKTADELGEYNSWKSGSSSNKDGKLDDNISLHTEGNGTGKWSTSAHTWSITQKATTSGAAKDGGYLEISVATGFVIKSVKITYTANSDGMIEGFSDDTSVEVDEGTTYIKGMVIPVDPESTATPSSNPVTARITSITVTYQVVE